MNGLKFKEAKEILENTRDTIVDIIDTDFVPYVSPKDIDAVEVYILKQHQLISLYRELSGMLCIEPEKDGNTMRLVCISGSEDVVKFYNLILELEEELKIIEELEEDLKDIEENGF